MLQAAPARHAKGIYDEEFRIVRPDGTMRWVRDRAFPVRDSAGQKPRSMSGFAFPNGKTQLLRRKLRIILLIWNFPTLP